jgi:hypothetical protein
MIPEIIATGAAVTAASKIKEDSLLGMLYKDTFQPSVQALGKALGNTIEFCTTPLLLCKFGSEAAQLNFKKRLDNYAKKLESITEDQALPVNPQIGIPIMDKLTYTTNDEIAELFINLLVKASSMETVNMAHPAFINIVENITPDEALILESVCTQTYIPYIGLKAVMDTTGGHSIIHDKQTDLPFTVNMQFSSNTPTYLDNLTSLGVLMRQDGVWLSDETIYNDLYVKHSYLGIEKALADTGAFKNTERIKGVYTVTDFGRSFIKACVKIKEI